MGGASKIVELLPEGYGYVILVAADSVILNTYFASRVVAARKKYKIEYPKMYADGNDEDAKMFNCIQRVHQNTLENYPAFLALLFIGGLQHPKITAGAGALYLVSRLFYARGYYTGDPKKRMQGQWGMLDILVMLGTTVCTAFHQLNWFTHGQKFFSK